MGDLQPLATADEYQARYGTVDADTAARLPDMLLDATALIMAELPTYVAGNNPVLDRNAKAVCCAVVHRALDRRVGYEGVSQASQTAGSYNASMTFANPDGALYLGASDRARLGIDAGVVLTCQMGGASCC